MSLLMPREAGAFILKHAKNVSISKKGIDKLTKAIEDGLDSGDVSMNNFSQSSLHPKSDEPHAVDWIFLIDTLNFSFWTPKQSPSWLVTWKGKTHSGYFAFCAAVNRSIEEGYPITDPKFYSKITKEQAAKLFRQDNPDDPEIPMLEERVSCMHQTGKKLLEKYDGSFVNCIKAANHSAQSLLKLIVTEFPCFNDTAHFHGQEVAIFKRVQILIADIWACFKGEGLGRFDDIDTITMFADYRIPQVLVHFGAMQYSDELLKKLKNYEYLENGSPDEVEIRGVSIECVEQVTNQVNKSGRHVNSIMIDHFLWDYRRLHADTMDDVVPYHQTRSVYY